MKKKGTKARDVRCTFPLSRITMRVEGLTEGFFLIGAD